MEGITENAKVGKASPNQRVKLWLTLLLAGLLAGLLVGLFLGLHWGLLVGLLVGLFFGLIGGLHLGGSAVIKHYALRLVLCLRGYTPLKFVRFLDHCARLILLKKAGGGYIFIHRMLLEYFAELDTSRNSAINR